MPDQAPYSYIRDYYRSVQDKYRRYPEMAEFCRAQLGRIAGEAVLNVGCGPLLYDDLAHLGAVPRRYVGLDINRATFDFLQRSRDPQLLRAKAAVRGRGTRVEQLCADVLDCGDALRGRFDAVVGVGVLATFHGPRFAPVLAVLRGALRDGGSLLKITWHGPRRTAEETRRKLAYRYDAPVEPSPEELIAGIEAAGFALRHQAVLGCDPDSYGWHAIQACLFART